MTKLQKNILFVLGSICLIVLSLFLLASTQKTQDTATTNTIPFSGEGKVLAKPDIAKVEFAIVTQANTSKEAQDANSPKSKAVVDFLKKQGIAEKDIKTASYNIFPRYDYPRFDAPRISGYEVTQKFEIKIRDLDKTNTILDGLVSAGANNIANVSFTVDEPEKLQVEARAKAIADAKKKAKDLEKQLGVKLGKIVNFSENNDRYYPIRYSSSKDIASSLGGKAELELPLGENEIKVDVTITYQIK